MKKIYKLKNWYSIQDASERLTLTLGETINMKDVLQLALEGHLKLSWYIRHVSAIKVEYEKRTIKPLPKFLAKELPETIDGIISEDFYETKGQSTITILDGAHHILLEHCGALFDYLLAHITNTGGELVSIDGFYVQDNSNCTWQILERFDEAHLKLMDPENKRMFSDKENYFPSGEWPELSELGFTKDDIEEFENKLQVAPKNTNLELTSKDKTSIYKIIYTMATSKYGLEKEPREVVSKVLNSMQNLGLDMDRKTLKKWLDNSKEYIENLK